MRWFTIVLAALIAFSWQSFVTQTHVHFEPGASQGSLAVHDRASPQLAHRETPADSPADCPICHEIAQAGTYLPSAPILFDHPVAVFNWLVPTLLVSSTARPRSHAWRSRGPPFFVQA